MKNTWLLEELSWPEVQAALDRGVRTVVIVTASIEQHGPHLPTQTDTAIGQVVGELVARKLGQTLLAPVIRPGCSDHHLAFPGSVSIPAEVLIETVLGYIRSLAPHGFHTFVLLSSHGGNFDALEVAARRAREELAGRGIRIVDVAGRRALTEMMRVMVAAAAAQGAPQDVDAIHADATETAIMMARYPHLVAVDRRERGLLGRIDLQELFHRGLRALTPNGIMGDATLATSEIGAVVLERLSDHLVGEVRRQLNAQE